MNMLVCAWGDSCDGTQIEVNFEKWSKKSWVKHETRVSLKEIGRKTETNSVNDVRNGLRMASLCSEEETRPNEAYKWVGTTCEVSL